MTRIKGALAALFMTATALSVSSLAAQDTEPFDFAKYAASSATLSAIATAVSLVEPCGQPLSYTEEIIESYGVVELTVACIGDGDEEAAVILRFDIQENGYLIPQSFELAG